MTIRITTIIKIQLNHFEAPVFAKAAARQYGKGGGGKSGKNPSGGKGGQQKGGATNPPSDNPTDAAERYFKRHGKYPPWDPLKRKPN